MDLRADGKHIPSAATRKIHQRLCIERHVVVHEQGPVEPRPPKPQIDGGAKAQRLRAMDPVDVAILRVQCCVQAARRAVGNDDDLLRLVDRFKRDANTVQGFTQEIRRIALGNDH